MRLDWKDGVLFSSGFVLGVGVAMVLHEVFGLEAGSRVVQGTATTLSFGSPAARRAIFGAPALPPRRGGVWSLLSIAGLPGTFSGAGALALGGLALARSAARTPDFAAEARGVLATSPRIEVTMSDPRETTSARDARVAREAREREARDAAMVRELTAQRRSAWEQSRASSRGTGLAVAAAGVARTLLGALCLRARYPRGAQPPAVTPE